VVILDASALLAQLFRGPGHQRVEHALGTACISTVNLAAVLTRLVRDGIESGAVLVDVEQSGLQVIPFDDVQAALAAKLWTETPAADLSLGDRACLVLAIDRALPVLTADHAWAGLGLSVPVQLIR
jgi:ribonuclease VapC